MRHQLHVSLEGEGEETRERSLPVKQKLPAPRVSATRTRVPQARRHPAAPQDIRALPESARGVGAGNKHLRFCQGTG